MRFQCVTALLTFTLLLSGCNDDMASNRAEKNPQRMASETVTVYSGIHRERGTTPVSYNTEIGLNSVSNNIRPIPDMRFDDEGGDEKNVTIRTRPTKKCGLTIKATLKEKIADCLSLNGDKTIWNGTINANSAEATWVLVTLSENINGAAYEIWLDQRTGMVWSDVVDIEGNWCEASGSQLQSSDNVGENCEVTGKGQSLCTSYSPNELPGINWRLPTRHDYLQADIDGIRFVLAKVAPHVFWTATTSSDVKARDKAWSYNMINGTLVAELMNSNRLVRCIGTPNF